jgi:chromosome segregation ATPase
LDEYGFEKVDSSGEDIVEMNARLLALEQAFSIDSRRSKGRGAGAINDSGEMDELRESLSNLYEIVQNLPSIDSLQVKIDAVDKAVEEMNSTIEMINAVAKKMETSEIDAALKASGDAAAAANEALTEAKKISEEQTGLSAKLKEVATASGVYEALLVQFEEEKKARLLLTEQLDKQKAGTDALAKQIADLGKDQSSELIPKIEAVNRNIAVIDKNVKVLSSSYKMVYDNALRVDDRLGRLEKDGDRVADRISLLEKNLLPPE